MSRQQSGSDTGNDKQASRSPSDASDATDAAHGKLSVREAGRKGGLRVRELIARGREVEARQGDQRMH